MQQSCLQGNFFAYIGVTDSSLPPRLVSKPLWMSRGGSSDSTALGSQCCLPVSGDRLVEVSLKPRTLVSDMNYEGQWWALIYDQMMTSAASDWLQCNRAFYRSHLDGVSGPVLECACGTGLILLPLLTAGHDMYGFDASEPMLRTLRDKAKGQGIGDIDQRVSVQRFELFNYEHRFASITIPTNSFAMLTSQDAQLDTLRNIHDHLEPDGTLLLDLRLVDMRSLVDGGTVQEGRWRVWDHPETGRPIRQRIIGGVDFDTQLVLDRCVIEYDGETTEFAMTSRWISKEEFQLLLRHAGFRSWTAYGSPTGDQLHLGPEETLSYWVVKKTL